VLHCFMKLVLLTSARGLMEEYHRLARVKICPITVCHSIGKMSNHGEDVSLPAVIENMSKEYGQETISGQQELIERQYWIWLSKYYDLTVDSQ
jgi:hypothetical protein